MVSMHPCTLAEPSLARLHHLSQRGASDALEKLLQQSPRYTDPPSLGVERLSPIQIGWHILCQRIDAVADEQRAAEVQRWLPVLHAWPDHARVAPWPWWTHLRDNLGEDPRWQLVRRLDLSHRRLTVHDGRALRSPALGQITQLILDHASLPGEALSFVLADHCLPSLHTLSVHGLTLTPPLRWRSRPRWPWRHLPRLSFGPRDINMVVGIAARLPMLHQTLLGDGNFHVVYEKDDPIMLACPAERLAIYMRCVQDVAPPSPRAIARMFLNPTMRDVEALMLEDCPLHNEGAQVIAALGREISIKHLSVNDCGIRSRGFRALLRAPCLREMETLDLGYNDLKSKDVYCLMAHQGWPKLRWLNLRGVRLGAATWRALLRHRRRHRRGEWCLDLHWEDEATRRDVERRVSPARFEALMSGEGAWF